MIPTVGLVLVKLLFVMVWIYVVLSLAMLYKIAGHSLGYIIVWHTL